MPCTVRPTHNTGTKLQRVVKEAEHLMEQALDITRKALGEEHPKVAIRLNNLAQLYDAKVNNGSVALLSEFVA